VDDHAAMIAARLLAHAAIENVEKHIETEVAVAVSVDLITRIPIKFGAFLKLLR
jgi:hypothetical protein